MSVGPSAGGGPGAVNAGSVLVSVGADISGLQNGLRQAGAETQRLTGSLNREAGALRGSATAADHASRAHLRLHERVGNLRIGFLGMNTATLAAGAAVFGLVNEFANAKKEGDGLSFTIHQLARDLLSLKPIALIGDIGGVFKGLGDNLIHDNRQLDEMRAKLATLVQAAQATEFTRRQAQRLVTGGISLPAVRRPGAGPVQTELPDFLQLRIIAAENRGNKAAERNALRAGLNFVKFQENDTRVTTAELVNLERLRKDLLDQLRALKPQAKQIAFELPQALQLGLAQAGTTKMLSDDLLQQVKILAYLTVRSTFERNTTKKIQELNQLKATREQIEALNEALKPAPQEAKPFELPKRLQLAEAQAGITQSTRDDLIVLRQIDSYLTVRIGSEKNIDRKIQELQLQGQKRQQIASLTGAGQGTTVTDLFQGPFLSSPNFQLATQFGYKPKGRDLLADIKAQVQQAKQFQVDLGALSRRGATPDLISSLRALGPQAYEQTHALAAAGPGLVRQYSRFFLTRERQLKTQMVAIQADTVTVTSANGAGGDTTINVSPELSIAAAVQHGLRRAKFAMTHL